MSRPEPTGEAMRRTRAGGYPIKARRRNTATPKRRNAPKAKRSRSSPTALKETKVARLTRELQEALAQQTATSDVLRAISSTPGELEPVFNAMLEKATRICEATFGNLFLREGHSFRAVAVHTNKQGYDLRRNPVIDLRENPGVPLERLVNTKKIIHISDLRADQSYIGKNDRMISLVETAGARTFLIVPMLKEDELIGSINMYRQEVRLFTDKQIALVQNFAAQAVIAIENTRLLNELRQRTEELAHSVEELRALGEVSQAVNSTLDLEPLLSTIVAKAVQLSGTEAGAIYVYEEAAHEFRLRATYGMAPALIDALSRVHIGVDEPTVALVLAGREPIQVADLRGEAASEINEITLRAGYRARLVAPLIRGDEVVGLLVVRRRAPGAFAKNTIDLLKTFAAQSLLAIQNARLFHEIEDKGRQLESASKHKTQFLANMSHELRTPLNAVLGYTELILDNIYGEAPEKMRAVVERVQANGKHLLGLINDVLDLSKIEAGQFMLSLNDYSIKEMVQGVYVAVEALASSKKLSFIVELPPALPVARGDDRRLTQVLLNLVGNAIKFTDQGEVAIKASATNGAYTIAVRDTGPGILPADQEKIFEEFQQVDSSATKTKSGTGLGLSIAKRIVEMHGGRLWVESSPACGSTFSFTVPIRVERQAERQ
jgi:signal transduction histidine kinase